MTMRLLLSSKRNNWARKYAIRIGVLIGLYVIYCVLSSKRPEDPKNPYYSEIDQSVETSSYLREYERYWERKRGIKVKLDAVNEQRGVKRVVVGKRDRSNLEKPDYLMLAFTTIFGANRYCESGKSQELFVDQCPYKNCRFSCDRSKARSADLVLFHAEDLIHESTETRVYLKQFLARLDSRHEQIWVLWHDEPSQVPRSLNKYKFNWTLSYPIDSEISDCSYGCTYENNDKDKELFVQEIEREYHQRKASAVWFVSNCGANFRNDFALELKTHIDVRIYGRCRKQFLLNMKSRAVFKIYSFFRSIIDFITVPLKFLQFLFADNSPEKNKDEKEAVDIDCKRDSQCEYDEFSSNLFYLAFESKNCSGYITEKLWRILNTRMIPIVIQPSREVYEQVAPKNSFIHAQDFDFNVARLAEYLHSIAADFDKYMFHQRWRLESNAVHSMLKSEQRRLCELCTKLNTETDLVYYERVSEWFQHQCF